MRGDASEIDGGFMREMGREGQGSEEDRTGWDRREVMHPTVTETSWEP